MAASAPLLLRLTLGTTSSAWTYVDTKSLLLAAIPSLNRPPGGAKHKQRRSGYRLRNINATGAAVPAPGEDAQSHVGA